MAEPVELDHLPDLLLCHLAGFLGAALSGAGPWSIASLGALWRSVRWFKRGPLVLRGNRHEQRIVRGRQLEAEQQLLRLCDAEGWILKFYEL